MDTGPFISLGSFPGNDVTNEVLILKVEGIARNELIAIIEPLIVEVMDAREV